MHKSLLISLLILVTGANGLNKSIFHRPAETHEQYQSSSPKDNCVWVYDKPDYTGKKLEFCDPVKENDAFVCGFLSLGALSGQV